MSGMMSGTTAERQDVLVVGGGAHVEEIPFAPPEHGAPWGRYEAAHGSVRVVPARGRIPGTTDYPPPVEGPRIPWRKRALEREELDYCPQMHVPEHPTSWDFPAYLDNPDCRWLQTIKRMYGMQVAFPASLSPEAALLVHALVRNIRPRVVVETGTFIGMSTIWIAAALKENGDGGTIHTFDDYSPIPKGPWRDVEIAEGRLRLVADLITEAGVHDHVVMHVGNSPFELRAAREEILGEGGAQLTFLDADHGYVGVCQDFWAAEPMINTGGFLMFHDTFPEYCSHDGPRQLIDRINKLGEGLYQKVDMYLSPMNYGLGLLRRIG